MYRQNMELNRDDIDAVKMLEEFLPKKIFDAHAHLIDGTADCVLDGTKYKNEMSRVLCNPSELLMNIITFPDAKMKTDFEVIKKSDAFLVEQLSKHKGAVGEIIVHPRESVCDIEKRLVHPMIRGFKCYHLLCDRPGTFNADICEYLPESAWQLAHERKMCITLHLVKDKALADKDNLDYICKMAKKYPDAVLILAHAARSFAAWTAIESVEKVAQYKNIWFDFSAVCESPAMMQIVKKAGLSRCMWGSDYPVCRAGGKAISLADSFYWIYERDIENFQSKTPIRHFKIALENLLAVKQMCTLLDIDKNGVEDLFYNNAKRLFLE